MKIQIKKLQYYCSVVKLQKHCFNLLVCPLLQLFFMPLFYFYTANQNNLLLPQSGLDEDVLKLLELITLIYYNKNE